MQKIPSSTIGEGTIFKATINGPELVVVQDRGNLLLCGPVNEQVLLTCPWTARKLRKEPRFTRIGETGQHFFVWYFSGHGSSFVGIPEKMITTLSRDEHPEVWQYEQITMPNAGPTRPTSGFEGRRTRRNQKLV